LTHFVHQPDNASIIASKSGLPRIVNVSGIGHEISSIRFDDSWFEEGKLYSK
jgi:hypothetical protein